MMRALRLVSDDHDDAAIAQELHARGRASDSALVVTPTPGRAGEGIGRDLLSAMGKRFDAPGTPRKPEVLLDRADSWMRARSIDQLVVCHAERLTSAVRTRLTTLGPEHATLWLIDDPTMTPNKPAEDPQGSPASMTELLAVIGNSKMHNAPVASDLECSRAPDVDYPFFALACRRAGAEVLFANLVLGRNHALRLIDHAGTRPGPDVVNRLLTGAAQCAVGTDAKIARIRGAQLELLKSASIHTRIDAAELRARMTAHALSAPDPKTRRLLDGYVEPLPAALAAASVCTGRGPAWLSKLTFGDLGHESYCQMLWMRWRENAQAATFSSMI